MRKFIFYINIQSERVLELIFRNNIFQDIYFFCKFKSNVNSKN